MSIPDNLRYTKEHEWALLERDIVTVGLTDYAQQSLGEIVFVEAPSEGAGFSKGDVLGAVESTKAVSDIFSPVTGKVVEVNEALLDSPNTINNSPYGDGWLVKIAPDGSSLLEDLMDSEAYKKFLETAT
ncbi:MAG: glycine cleavage system protein GcvH [Candidatus Mycalebacterium zealandia]|nr:MAG: glycine cleavage system protein GcvH [Candidatus Mycalebacterium zealandia]